MSLTITWLRRDLRLHDHAALHHAQKVGVPTQPVFIFDPAILARFTNPKDRRVNFIAQQLQRMHAQLQQQGAGLLVFYGKPQDVLPQLAQACAAHKVIAAQDYEPASTARDDALQKLLQAQSPLSLVQDHVIMPPTAVLKDDGTPYKVFTPYSKRWRQMLPPDAFAELAVPPNQLLADYAHTAKQADACQALKRLDARSAASMLEQIGYAPVVDNDWPLDDVPARLQQFMQHKIEHYHTGRDMLAAGGTSQLSPYLRFGVVSLRECCRLAAEHIGKGADTWLNELIWREFYIQILYHFPHTIGQAFQPQYANIAWQNNPDWLAKWQQGQTGFPVIDAAMRQLLHTGWMHNRARMIVASFLTKDLLLDWRLGEEHFAQHLMDYEQASNVGGWQWAASTGTDAQPYFRVFNPLLQSQRFDPEGDYIRRYVPELEALNSKQIHAPNQGKDLFSNINYPQPIIDHKTQKEKAIALFKQAGQ